ncbi:MAG: hypothetical protein EBU88_16490, partial [Acidobacteria bacterium]|nr:hypothetical protein [Acidobacteriota bacterium]
MRRYGQVLILAAMTVIAGLATASPQMVRKTGVQERGVGVKTARTGQAALTNHALLIYVQDYQDANLRLENPKIDAERIERTLTRNYQFERTNVRTLGNPDRETLLNTLEEYAEKMTNQNALLIFYAGHGVWDEKIGQGYWLPVNATSGRRSNWISNSDIRDRIKSIRSRHTLLISDACFSGSLLRDTPGTFGRTVAIDELTRLPSRRAMTSGALTTVPDRSVFVDYLVSRLESNTEQYLTAGTLFDRLEIPVINNSRTKQTPRYGVIPEADDEGGQFVFVRRTRAAESDEVTVIPPVPRPTLDPEEEAWKQVANTTGVDVVKDFLTAFPSGRYATAARLKLRVLEAAKETARVEELKSGLPTVLTSFTRGEVVNGKVGRSQGECEVYTEDLGNGVKLEMVKIPEGEFLMGEDEAGAAEYEKECGRHWNKKEDCKKWAGWQTPQHRVSMKGFLMGKYEVTQRQWRAVMGGLPAEMEKLEAKFKSDDKPVVMVSWDEVQQFLKKLGKGYRLPSEAEWEYAARAGTRTAYGFGAEITPEIVNYNGDFPAGKTAKGLYRNMPVVVGSLGLANRFGLYDMHGNVWEWCE